MNRIGDMIPFNKGTDLEERFSTMRKYGFESVQINCWDPDLYGDLEVAEKVRDLAKKYGITISHFWCGYGGPAVWNFTEGPSTIGLVPDQYREERVAQLKMGSEFAKVLGTKYLVTHVGFMPEDPSDPKYAPTIQALKEVVAYCWMNGQIFLFETGQETPVVIKRAIEDIKANNVGINLDPANLILYGKANPVDALDIIGPYVKGLHAKDGFYPTEGRNLGREVPVGEGKVNFEKLLERLVHEFHYYEDITIEREIQEGSPEQMRDILRTRDYLQSILERL